MEAVGLAELLDIVKEIVGITPILSTSTNRPVLPPSVQPLPKWAASLPEGPIPLPRAVERLTTDILPYVNAQSLSPNFYGFVVGGATPAALLADMVTSMIDQNVCVHLPKETIATYVEVAALNMLVNLFNLPAKEWAVGTSGNGGGHITSGATGSNILGMALGREYVLSKAAERVAGKPMSVGEHGILEVSRAANIDKIIVLSTMSHSSLVKAASIVGLGRSSVISIARDEGGFDIDVNRLRKLAETAKDDRIAYILAISAGEVNTGRFVVSAGGTLKEVREICDQHGIWIHVDGAFGLFARMFMGQPQTQEYARILDGVQGLEFADSITTDAHKLLNVPYDCGIFFTRHKQISEQVFLNGNASYLKTEALGGEQIQTPLNIGLENSRRFRALPVYLTLSAYGREGYIDMLKRQISLARKAASWLWDNEHYDLLPKENSKDDALASTFMVVLFRAKDDTINNELVKRINATSKIYVSGTQWDGKPAARIAISNWQVDPDRDFALIQEVLSQVV